MKLRTRLLVQCFDRFHFGAIAARIAFHLHPEPMTMRELMDALCEVSRACGMGEETNGFIPEFLRLSGFLLVPKQHGGTVVYAATENLLNQPLEEQLHLAVTDLRKAEKTTVFYAIKREDVVVEIPNPTTLPVFLSLQKSGKRRGEILIERRRETVELEKKGGAL